MFVTETMAPPISASFNQIFRLERSAVMADMPSLERP